MFLSWETYWELFAVAGIGTTGNSFGFGIKENNFLGQGVKLDSEIVLGSDSIKGKFSASNPNFKNTDKSLKFSLEASELDNYKTYGYKSNKTGFILELNLSIMMIYI